MNNELFLLSTRFFDLHKENATCVVTRIVEVVGVVLGNGKGGKRGKVCVQEG